MAKASQILGLDNFNNLVNNARNLNKSDDEINALVQSKVQEIKELNKQHEEQKLKAFSGLDEDTFSNKLLRGGAEATARGIAFVDGITNKFDLTKDLISDKTSDINTQKLEHLEKLKKEDSDKGNWSDITPERKEEKRLLELESANADGITEDAIAGVKTMYDVATNPNEWTTQGVVAGVMPSDPANLLAFVTGGIGGKIIQSVTGKISFGIADGMLVNAGTEYAIAKGSGKTDEEAKKIAIQSGTAGALVPTVISTATAFATSKNKKALTPKEVKTKLESQTKTTETVYGNIKQSLSDMNGGKVVDDDSKDGVVKKAMDDEAINDIKTINEAEQIATQKYNDTTIKIQEAYDNGATLDEMIAIKDNVKIDDIELSMSKIINNGEPTTPDVAGFKIVNLIEDNIKMQSLTPDEVSAKLKNRNLSPELVSVATKSYMVKNTDMLVDFISNKVDEHLNIKNENIKTDILNKVDIYNKQIIADDVAWGNSLTKKSVDDFIDTNIGKDMVNESQRGLIHLLNRFGLVKDVKQENITKTFGIKKSADGVYDKNNHTVSLDDGVASVDKMQVVTHEYIHSATTRLLENKEFYNDVKSLMDSAKGQSKDKKQYGFTTPDEFVAEAFSDPIFAKELNDMKLTNAMKVKYGVSEHIKSVWDLVVEKFADVVYVATGRKFNINKDSYFASLNDIVSKQIKELEDIKAQRLDDGSSLKQTHLEDVKKIPKIDMLQTHPRYKELMDMRRDISAEQTKGNKKVLNRGTVVHDKDKFGGVDNTQVVPTSYEKNWNGDFRLTKQDIKNIEAGKLTDDLVAKIDEDLNTLDTHPDWMLKPDDMDVVQSKEILGKDFNDNYYVNFKGEVVKDGNLLFSINKNTKEIDFKALDKFAIPIPKNKSVLGFVAELKKTIKTPIGDLKVDVDYVLNKSTQRDGGTRIDFMNLIKPTLESPAYIVKHKGTFNFIKPFIDEKSKVKKFLSVISDRDGNVKIVTSHKLQNTDIRKIVKNGDVIEDFVGGATELAPVPPRAELKNSKASNSVDNIIPNKNNKSQDNKNLLFHQKVEQKKEFSQWDKKVNKYVDIIFEKGIMKGVESMTFPIKALVDGMTGGKFDINTKNWFEVTQIQKDTNEIINDFNLNQTSIYEKATVLKESLSHLSKEQNRDLLNVLGGDMNLKDLSDDLKPLYKDFRKEIDTNANDLVELGILNKDEKIKDYVKRYYTKYLEDTKEIKRTPSKSFQKFYKRKDLDYETRVKLGMVEDAGLVISNTIAEQNILKQKAMVLKSLADKFGKDIGINDDVPNGYVRISDETVKSGVKKWGDLGGKYVPKELKTELDTSRIVSQEVRFWEDIMYGMVDHIKVNVTVKNPNTHVYNIGSNISLSFIAGDFPALGKTLYMMMAKPDEFKALVKKANSHGLNSYLDDFEKPMAGFLDKDKKKVSVAMTIAKNLYLTQDSASGKFARKLYDWEDKIFKVARFKRLLDEGFDEKTAYKEAVSVYVDYSTPVPSALRFLDKGGLMPFLHYQYKATPAVAKTIAKNPFKAIILGTGIASIGGLRWQDTDDKYLKPKWADNKTIGNQFFTKEWVKIGNSGYYWNLGRVVPGTKFDFDFGGFVKGLMYINDGRSPLGYEVVKEGADYEYLKQGMMIVENYTPPITYGRYGQKLIKLGLGKAGIIEPPQNKVSKKDDTVADIMLRGVGVREFDEKKELKTHLRKAIKDKDEDKIVKIRQIRRNKFNLNEDVKGTKKKKGDGFGFGKASFKF